MIKPPRNPYGYRNLLVYKKAEELQIALADFVKTFSRHKTLAELADQMERSARSTKQNIIEGWKRNSTNEYYQFLGFAIASNAELEADCTDIIKGIYGGKGLKGINAAEHGGDIEKIPFYPLNTHLPLYLQLKLRAKELNFLLDKLQSSLLEKMRKEKTLSATERIRIQNQKEAVFRKEHEVYLKAKGWN
ncbi:MAG: four helix bundle protein [Parcubacteria group bacterium]|nr:four helix bundle protein [Parcubacteria group bacterium]